MEEAGVLLCEAVQAACAGSIPGMTQTGRGRVVWDLLQGELGL